MDRHLGVDLGATNVVSVAVDDGGRLLGRATADRDADDAAAIRATLLATARAAREDADVDPADVATVGIAAAGPLDVEAGAAVDPPNVDGVDRIDLIDPLSDRFADATVALFNDAAAGALGERYVADRSAENLVYLTVSSGIGAGVVVDDRVLRGHRAGAGEVGHMTVDPDGGRRCGCGGVGHWEAYSGGANLPGVAADLAAERDLETDLPLSDPGFDAADVYDLAGDDPLATLVVERATAYNVVGVVNVVQAYAPEVVAVGGGVALGSPELVVDPLRERVPDRVLVEAPSIEPAALGEDAVALGASYGARSDAGGSARPPTRS
ncbi:MAG: ROK family protein [Halobacteriales archaeon]